MFYFFKHVCSFRFKTKPDKNQYYRTTGEYGRFPTQDSRNLNRESGQILNE